MIVGDFNDSGEPIVYGIVFFPRLEIMLAVLALLLIGCEPSNEERGCQHFTQLVEDVSIASEHQPKFNYATGEMSAIKSEIAEVSTLLGKESSLPLDSLAIVVRLESIVEFYFDDTPNYKRIRQNAYKLWAAARGVYYGSEWAPEGQPWMLIMDGEIAAERLAQACEDDGHPSPSHDNRLTHEVCRAELPATA